VFQLLPALQLPVKGGSLLENLFGLLLVLPEIFLGAQGLDFRQALFQVFQIKDTPGIFRFFRSAV